MDKSDKKEKIHKIKVELDLDIVNKLIKLKNFGDTYSDVIERLLEK